MVQHRGLAGAAHRPLLPPGRKSEAWNEEAEDAVQPA